MPKRNNVPSARLILLCSCSCAILGGTSTAWATLKKNYETRPINIDGFLLKPRLNLQQHYTDNVLASPNAQENDFVTEITPALGIQKNIRDHEIKFEASAQVRRHINNSDEDVINAGASLSSLLIAKRSFKIPLSVSYEKAHLERHRETAILSPTRPTQIQGTSVKGGFIYAPNRLRIEIFGRYEQKRFKNGALTDGTDLIRSDDDYNQTSVMSEARYNMRTGWSPFLKFKTHRTHFLRRSHNGISFNGKNRDHSYNSVIAGVAFDKGTYTAHLGAGYDNIHYDSSSLNDLSALALEARLEWQPIERANIAFNLTRSSMNDDVLESAYINNSGGISLDYEMQRDLFLNAGATFERNSYTSGRNDRTYQGQVGMDYNLNRALQAHANITTRKRDSDAAQAEYLQNIFMLGITGNL